jgi:hypothetical protein
VLFRLFRKNRETPSLEAQIQFLKELGITFNLPDDELIAKLRENGDPQLYEKEPYSFLLSVAGTDLADGDGGVLRLSDDVLSFDIECVEEPDVYTRMVRRFVQLTRGEVGIDDLDGHVDFDEGTAWLSFTHEGRRHELDVKFEDDWFDVTIFDRIAAIVRRPGRQFARFMDGQTITLLYCTPEVLQTLNRAADNRFRALM